MRYKDIIPHAAEGEWSRLAPLRILSVDIECAAEKVGVFVCVGVGVWVYVCGLYGHIQCGVSMYGCVLWVCMGRCVWVVHDVHVVVAVYCTH